MTDTPEVTSASPAKGARCAVHPELEAERTCVRCGNYMCKPCVGDGGLGLCLACQQRSGTGAFPFDREHYNLDGLFRYSVARFKEHWMPLVLASAGFFVVVYGVALIGGFAIGIARPLRQGLGGNPFTLDFAVLQAVELLLQVGLQIPLLALCVDVAAGKEPAFGAALGRLRRLPAALLQLLIIYLALALAMVTLAALAFAITKLTGSSQHPPWLWFGVGALLASIPVVYFGLGAMFGMLELVYNPEASALGALRTSFLLVAGQRWPVLAIALLSGVIAVAGALACCVGIFASMPLASLLYCSLFLALRNDGKSHR